MPDEQTSSSGLKDTSGAGTVRIVGAGKFGGSSEVRKRAGDVAEHKRALARAKRLLAVALEDERAAQRVDRQGSNSRSSSLTSPSPGNGAWWLF